MGMLYVLYGVRRTVRTALQNSVVKNERGWLLVKARPNPLGELRAHFYTAPNGGIVRSARPTSELFSPEVLQDFIPYKRVSPLAPLDAAISPANRLHRQAVFFMPV